MYSEELEEKTRAVKARLDGLTLENLKTLYAMTYVCMLSEEQKREADKWTETTQEINRNF